MQANEIHERHSFIRKGVHAVMISQVCQLDDLAECLPGRDDLYGQYESDPTHDP